MEIRFIFDKIEPHQKVSELNAEFDFDDRNGLNYIIFGEHWSEVGNNKRLIHQIERSLNINLSLLDYWNDDVNDKDLSINELKKVFDNLKTKIENNPNFYQNIDYGFNIEESYLKKQFLKDIKYLIKRLDINIQNGSKKIKFEVD